MPILETKIIAVTVFPERARVTRAGTLTLEPGAHTITLANLPRTLEENSLRASGSGAARLGSMQLSARVLTTIPPGDAQAAQAKLQELFDQDKIYADETEAWQTRLNVVKNIGEQGGDNFARQLARGKLSLDGLTSALDYLNNSHEAASNALRDLIVRRRELQKQIDAARQEAEKYNQAITRQVYDAQWSLHVAAAGAVTLTVTYNVRGASWDALYDARLRDQKVEWNYLAAVKQNTGEDWNEPYALTLSTATLATGVDKPELSPWQLDLYQPPQPRAVKMRADSRQAMSAPAMMMAAAAPPPEPEMAYDLAQVASGGPSVTYTINAPGALPSDGQAHQVNIARLEFDAALDYFCAPKATEQAFVRAQFKNASDYMMLPGKAALFHAQEFVGARALEAIAPQQTVELFLGAEPRLRVARKETQREVNKTGLMGNMAGATLAYRIIIENPSLDVARITVLDQIPVSQHPDIKVKLREVTPRPTAQNEQGELTWQLEIKKDAKAQIDFAIAVEYPKEMRVAGL